MNTRSKVGLEVGLAGIIRPISDSQDDSSGDSHCCRGNLDFGLADAVSGFAFTKRRSRKEEIKRSIDVNALSSSAW
jgi:hypothetical protein